MSWSLPVAGRGSLPRVTVGLVLTGDVFVNSTDLRRRLFARFGAQAVEMEGEGLAQVAHHLCVPALIIRALSDLAGEARAVTAGLSWISWPTRRKTARGWCAGCCRCYEPGAIAPMISATRRMSASLPA